MAEGTIIKHEVMPDDVEEEVKVVRCTSIFPESPSDIHQDGPQIKEGSPPLPVGVFVKAEECQNIKTEVEPTKEEEEKGIKIEDNSHRIGVYSEITVKNEAEYSTTTPDHSSEACTSDADSVTRSNVCPQCRRWFPSRSQFEEHLATGEKIYICKMCQLRFCMFFLLSKHMQEHSGSRKVPCNYCSLLFDSNSSFCRHLQVHTKVKPFSCPEEGCGRSFRDRSVLIEHMSVHKGNKPYPCSECNKSFLSRTYLSEHMAIHTKVRRHTCQICTMAFTHRTSLRAHMAMHDGKKPHRCDECDRAFLRRNDLKRHMQVHSRGGTVECDICLKHFSCRGNLTRHQVVHTGEKRFLCIFCSRTFTWKANLRQHILLVHSGKKN